MKARAELCQKVIKYSLKDGRMIHRHSMTFWHAPAKLPESVRVSRLYLNRDSETTYVKAEPAGSFHGNHMICGEI